MTTLIGCRCKSGNIFSQALLIGRGLFLKLRKPVRSRVAFAKANASRTKHYDSDVEIFDFTGAKRQKQKELVKD